MKNFINEISVVLLFAIIGAINAWGGEGWGGEGWGGEGRGGEGEGRGYSGYGGWNGYRG